MEERNTRESTQCILEDFNKGAYGNAVLGLRDYKVRSELAGRSPQEYLEVVSRLRGDLLASPDMMWLPWDIARSEDGILYGLYGRSDRHGRVRLSGPAREEELRRLAMEYAWLREWRRVMRRGPPAYDDYIQQRWESDGVISGSEACWILTTAAELQDEASREISNLGSVNTEPMSDPILRQ